MKLEELHNAYKIYVQTCVDLLVSAKKLKIFPSERRKFFPTSEILSSQIIKNAQSQATDLIETWVKQRYPQKLKEFINEADLTKLQKLELRCCGKYRLQKAGKFGKGFISQEMVDLYWSWVWNSEIAGKSPVISDHFPMLMSEMTCVFGPSKKAEHFVWWLRFSSLDSGKRIEIPLAFNPYTKGLDILSKSVLVQKREDRWSFQFCEKVSSEVDFDGSQGKVGVDVGLNVLAATSDGRTYGASLKPKFDKLYKRVRRLRSNRQRQGFKENSHRLTRLEARLSGLVKSTTGETANKLVRSFPNFTFVIENLDLRGCRGQKRFAYRALHNSLIHKAKVEVVNPAYTSQMCPSCGYVSRSNRSGIKFICRGCGRKSHADAIGGINLLGRSEDKQVNSCENTAEVRSLLSGRYRLRRSSASSSLVNAPKPNGQKLTTRVSRKREIGIASNLVSSVIPTLSRFS